MNAKSNLKLARKYEWNAAMARAQNNTEAAERYDAMAKMATLDAGIDLSDMSSLNLANTNSRSQDSGHVVDIGWMWETSNKKEKIMMVISFFATLAFFAGIYVFAGTL